MGIIETVTPGSSKRTPVPHGSPTFQEITDLARINIHPYTDFVTARNDEIR